MKRLINLVFFIIFLTNTIFSQSTELVFKKKRFGFGKDKTILVYLSNSKGEEISNPQDVLKSKDFFFTYKPAEDWNFKEKDINKVLEKITLKQDDIQIKSGRLFPISKDGEIISVLATFSKEKIQQTKSIIFQNEAHVSSEIVIPEIYWSNYKEYFEFFENGKTKLSEKENINSFQSIAQFVLSEDEEITAYSFFGESEILMRNSINNFIADKETRFSELAAELNNNIDEQKLLMLDEIHASLVNSLKVFEPFFVKYSDEESQKFKQAIDELSNRLDSSITENNELFRQQLLSLFETGDYKSDYKFRLFIDLLTRMTIDIEYFKKIENSDTLKISIIEKYSSKKDELIDLEWYADFCSTINLINDNIKNKGYILNVAAMSNLENQKNVEIQPYSSIFKAFNALCGRDLDGFSENIKESFVKCIDSDFLSMLELWYLSYRSTTDNTSDKVISALNKGIEFEINNDLEGANKQYDKATRLASSFAPPFFYLGRIYHKKNEAIVAERYFVMALERYPEYMAPGLLKIDYYCNDEEYSKALKEVNATILTSPYWFFYYHKAMILKSLGQFTEAINILVGNCLKINHKDIDQYLLVGDLYLELFNDYNENDNSENAGSSLDSAEEYYLKAGLINPLDDGFSEKMVIFKKLKKEWNQ